MSGGISRPETRDISFVLQGHVDETGRGELKETIARLRQLAPDSQIIVSTWEACAGAAMEVGADAVVLSPDPGALPGIRISGETQNNVNRQIVSTRAGLERSDRAFAVKLRVDERLVSLGFLDLYASYQSQAGPERLVVPRLFTLDPTMFEQVPMHVSDWFQFGSTQALREYWDCPPMTPEQAVWYGSHSYAGHSTHLDRRFHCLFAVEQHLAMHYARKLGFAVPRYHNDIRPEVMVAHRQFLARHFIVAGLDQIGLSFAKYEWAEQSTFQDLNCLGFADWLELAAAEDGLELTSEQRRLIAMRGKRKALARRLYRLARPLWPALSNPRAKSIVNLLLRRMAPPSR